MNTEEVDDKWIECISKEDQNLFSYLRTGIVEKRGSDEDNGFALQTCRSTGSVESWIYEANFYDDVEEETREYGVHKILKFCVTRSRHLFDVLISKYESII